jgi:hypothetical protein
MDGTSFYVQPTELGMPVGIERVDVKSMHRAPIRGSQGMGEVRSLIDDPNTGRLFVTGQSRSEKTTGTFEIDPAAATLRVVSAPQEEPISADGLRVVRRVAKGFSIVDLRSGLPREIKGLSSAGRCTWSPNGLWVACASGGQILLVDAGDPSRQRSLGASGVFFVWSPDSQRLLLQSDCPDVPYGGRLDVIDIDSGSRIRVEGAECTANQRSFGWVDWGALR